MSKPATAAPPPASAAPAYCKHDLPDGSCVDCASPVRAVPKPRRPGDPVLAKFGGICVDCYGDIIPGDRIVHDGFEGWSHEDCS